MDSRFAVAALVVWSLASCGGTAGDGSRSGVAGEPSASPVTSTTLGDPAPVDNQVETSEATTSTTGGPTTSQPRSTPLPASSRGLARYLAAALNIGADLVEGQAVLNASGVDVIDGSSELWRNAVERFDALEPPPEAQEHHRMWMDLSKGFLVAFDTLAEDLSGNSEHDRQRALSSFLETTGELGADAIAADELQAELVLSVLGSHDDPLAEYVQASQDLQVQAQPLSEALFSPLAELASDPTSALDAMMEALKLYEPFAQAWEDLQPPTQAADLHRRRVEIITDSSALFEELVVAIESNAELSPDLLARLNDLAPRSQLMNAEVSRFTATVLLSLTA